MCGHGELSNTEKNTHRLIQHVQSGNFFRRLCHYSDTKVLSSVSLPELDIVLRCGLAFGFGLYPKGETGKKVNGNNSHSTYNLRFFLFRNTR